MPTTKATTVVTSQIVVERLVLRAVKKRQSTMRLSLDSCLTLLNLLLDWLEVVFGTLEWKLNYGLAVGDCYCFMYCKSPSEASYHGLEFVECGAEFVAEFDWCNDTLRHYLRIVPDSASSSKKSNVSLTENLSVCKTSGHFFALVLGV